MFWPKYFFVDNIFTLIFFVHIVFTQIYFVDNVLTQLYVVDNVMTKICSVENVLTLIFLVNNVLTQIFLVDNVGSLQRLPSFFCARLQQLCSWVSLSVILKHHLIFIFHFFILYICNFVILIYSSLTVTEHLGSLWKTSLWTFKLPEALNLYCSVFL